MPLPKRDWHAIGLATLSRISRKQRSKRNVVLGFDVIEYRGRPTGLGIGVMKPEEPMLNPSSRLIQNAECCADFGQIGVAQIADAHRSHTPERGRGALNLRGIGPHRKPQDSERVRLNSVAA